MIKRTFRLILTAVLAMVSAIAMAQKPVGDFIESFSYNNEKRGGDRTLKYYPEGNDFVCVNGNQRFTRALYGGYTDFRLETSDRPIFAVYKKGHHRNVRFRAIYDGKELQLDQTDYCEARYSDGSRRYVVKDKLWGGAQLIVNVVALVDTEGAIWQFKAEGFDKPLTMKALVCELATTKLRRMGEIGAAKPGCFAPSPTENKLVTKEWDAQGETYYVMELENIVEMPADTASALFAATDKRNKELASRIVFNTPDPFINTLGSALVMAADGDWDGQTWLHGCIGWRMPLAGWRAGYLGDVLGWNDRAISHFDAYAKSQVTNVEPTRPHPTPDKKLNWARAEKSWGTQMYSNGYICRYPGKSNNMHHYDMNLNYVDELLWHFCYDADTTYMRKMWPLLKSHLAWEKRNYAPDGDHLYDAYCCIWASDALYYNSGAVTHSTAYNYRGNRLAARIAEIIDEDGCLYTAEADRILKAMTERLWLKDKGHWAEFEDYMGLKRKHESPAVWSLYTPIDCEAGSPEQFYSATKFVDNYIPHIPVVADGKQYGHTISTTNWLPYSWSINNVAAAEVMHTALAYFKAGRPDAGYTLMKANIMDQMYLGECPGNFGQVSFYDAARGECYRDFGDCIGISSRTLLQGLFGIVPDALNGKCVVRPGFPAEWDSASVNTPYISYKYKWENHQATFEVTQNFTRPLQIVIRVNLGDGRYDEMVGTTAKHQTFTYTMPRRKSDAVVPNSVQTVVDATAYGLDEPSTEGKFKTVNISKHFNSEVDDIYKNKYLSPRSPYTTLQIPVQGIGEWCHPTLTAEINDSVFRTLIKDGTFTVAGVPFRTPAEGKNIVYTSLWDNCPTHVDIPVKGKASHAYLLMAGSTNHMQCRIDNGLVIAHYSDGTADTLRLRNPDNWCPIEQDFYVDNKAFYTTTPRPYRVCLGNGMVSRDLGKELGIVDVYDRRLPGGAAQMLKMPLKKDKKLKSLTLRTLSNDVVIGLMGVTLQ